MATSQNQNRVPLPIDSFLKDIVQAVHEFSNVIIMAEPGAGKTTRVPVALANANTNASEGVWIVLQPRRWAAKLTAHRIADENHWKLGEEVGYQVRFENKTSKNSRLIVMTEGVLLRKLIQDPALTKIQGVVLDEFHERSLDIDLALSLLKEIQESFRPDLKLVVMSATLDPGPIEKFLPEVKTFQIQGRTFPVQKKYLGNVNVLSAVKTALQDASLGERDILVFLHGSFEIERSRREIEDFLEAQGRTREIDVLPLYASLPEPQQQKVFEERFDRGKRVQKIILSTNIAETSLTLPNVGAVIDSGLAKVMRTDPQFGQDRLETLRISRASSEQRAGRAGRVSEGVCYRLWTDHEQSALRHFETPEIHRVNLSHALLYLSEFGVSDFSKFNWYESPKSSMLQYSLQELRSLRFMEAENGKITADGKRALTFPLAPKLAKLVLESEKEGVKSFGARLAAYLENQPKDAAVFNEEALLEALNRLSGSSLLAAKQLIGREEGLASVSLNDWPQYERALVASMKSKVFIQGKVVGRRRVQPKDATRPLPAAGLILNSTEKTDQGAPTIYAQSWIPLPLSFIQKFGQKKKRIFWDEEAKRVRALEGMFFEDLELSTPTEVAVPTEQAGQILAEFVLRDPEGTFSKNENFKQWLFRVDFYRKNKKDSDPNLAWDWNEVVPAVCSGKTKLEPVIEFPLQEYLEGLLDRSAVQRFQEWVPERLEMPTGSRILLDYSVEKPKLSVRLQEIFGWLDTPRLMNGRVPILIELLSPGFKPIQLTQDLRSFWSGAYFEVKKELKVRYPKHAWPEDPLTAKPEAKGRRRQS